MKRYGLAIIAASFIAITANNASAGSPSGSITSGSVAFGGALASPGFWKGVGAGMGIANQARQATINFRPAQQVAPAPARSIPLSPMSTKHQNLQIGAPAYHGIANSTPSFVPARNGR